MAQSAATMPISAIRLSPEKGLSKSSMVTLYAISAMPRSIRTRDKYLFMDGILYKQLVYVRREQLHCDRHQDHPENLTDHVQAGVPEPSLDLT